MSEQVSPGLRLKYELIHIFLSAFVAGVIVGIITKFTGMKINFFVAICLYVAVIQVWKSYIIKYWFEPEKYPRNEGKVIGYLKTFLYVGYIGILMAMYETYEIYANEILIGGEILAAFLILLLQPLAIIWFSLKLLREGPAPQKLKEA